METLWQIVTRQSTLGIGPGVTLWDHLHNQRALVGPNQYPANLWGTVLSHSSVETEPGATFYDHMVNLRTQEQNPCIPIGALAPVADAVAEVVSGATDKILLGTTTSIDIVSGFLTISTDPVKLEIAPDFVACLEIDTCPSSIPDPLPVTIIPPDDVLDVCGALIVMNISVVLPVDDPNDEYIHVYEWEQETGSPVQLTITNNGLTAAYIRDVLVPYTFRFYADRGTRWETSELFTVIDLVKTSVTVELQGLRNALSSTPSMRERTILIGNGGVPVGGELTSISPARVWWRFEVYPNASENFIRFNLYSDDGVVQNLVYSSFDSSGLGQYLPAAGRYYVEGVFQQYTVRSATIRVNPTRDYGPYGKRLVSINAVELSQVAPAMPQLELLRKVRLALRKQLLSVSTVEEGDIAEVVAALEVRRLTGLAKNTISMSIAVLGDVKTPLTTVGLTRLNAGEVGG